MTDTSEQPLDKLNEMVHRIGMVGSAQSVLRWDQQVMMPPRGTPARAGQLGALSSIRHELLTSDELSACVEAVERESLGDRESALVREVKREHERVAKVPSSLIQRISEETTKAHSVWENARASDDFGSFASSLETVIGLKREYAEYIDPDRDPYAVLFEEYEPYLDLATTEQILGEIEDRIPELVRKVDTEGASVVIPSGSFSVEKQEAVVRTILDRLGFDWDRGRLDTSTHPFSTGNMHDARITTRFDSSDPLDGIMSAVHEFGHALYSLGLPAEEFGTPLGSPRDLSVHESQSRFWENHIARSHAFWESFQPVLAGEFGEFRDTSPRTLYRAVNQIQPDNLIRVEADELTYHLHIIVRFEIERDLIRGDLDVDELPGVWNRKMKEKLEVEPDSDTNGCLQDIHWSQGSFGYFPTYTLGSVFAAQLFDALSRDIAGVESDVRNSEFGSIRGWLRENIHRHGSVFTTSELIERATGESLSAGPFLSHAENRLSRVYDLAV